jgi:DNA polymerase V
MEVLAAKLSPRSMCQMGLFDGIGDRAEKVAAMKRQINERHGWFVLGSAATLPLVGVYGDKSNGYDICDVRGKMCF